LTVLDASFLAKVVLEEEGSRAARRLLRGWLEAGEPLHTVDLAYAELVNVLWKHAAKIGDLEPGQALEALEDLDRLWRLLDVHPAPELARDALRIAVEENVTGYDALYLAAATRYGGPLATFDQRLAAAAHRLGVTVAP